MTLFALVFTSSLSFAAQQDDAFSAVVTQTGELTADGLPERLLTVNVPGDEVRSLHIATPTAELTVDDSTPVTHFARATTRRRVIGVHVAARTDGQGNRWNASVRANDDGTISIHEDVQRGVDIGLRHDAVVSGDLLAGNAELRIVLEGEDAGDIDSLLFTFSDGRTTTTATAEVLRTERVFELPLIIDSSPVGYAYPMEVDVLDDRGHRVSSEDVVLNFVEVPSADGSGSTELGVLAHGGGARLWPARDSGPSLAISGD